jgi:hypothetical protein
MALNITGPLSLRVNVTTSFSTSLTPTNALFDQYCATSQDTNLTINAPTGTPANGDKLTFRIKSDGVATRTVTLATGSNGAFRAIGVTLPVTVGAAGGSTGIKTAYIGCSYNADDQRWDVIAVGQEA